MKKLATILLSTVLLSPFAYAADEVVGTYKGGDVKESQVMEQFKAAFESQPNLKGKKFAELDKNIQETLVRGYINGKLLDEEVKKAGIEDTKEFKEKIAAMRDQLAKQEIIEKFLKTAVTDSMIDAEYDKMAKEMKGQEEVKASHILVDSKEKAEEVKKKLSKGAKFADVAKEFSKDESTKASGGSLGYFTKGQLVPEFEQKAYSMKNGEISDPVKTQFGWHVIKVEDKRAIKLPTKEEAKPALAKKLSGEAVEKYFADLAAKADVKISLPAEAKKQ